MKARLVAIPVLAMLMVAAGPVRAEEPAPETIGWEEAGRHMGEEATVEGRILGVHCSPLSCLLAFDPTFTRFTAVIDGGRLGAFPKPSQLEEQFSGKRVQVHGRIVDNHGKPEIHLAAPEDLQVVVSPAEKERERQRTLETEVELLQRVGDVLTRIETLTERIAAVQDRTDAVLARLEQRTLELAAAQIGPPPLPPGTGTGWPQPRPAYEALRSVKRGMTQADVRRLVGDPLYVDSTPTGVSTWYYAFGRSVTFDARGRAESLMGFTTP